MISRMHFITHEVNGDPHDFLATQACKGGVEWIQLRVKDKDHEEWKSIALEVQEICKRYNSKLIINDNVLLAKEINAEGVHLGKTDMRPSEARKILGSSFIIGGTANTFEDIERLSQERVDYIGLGPYRYTTTKKNLSPVLGVSGYKKILGQMKQAGIDIPVIAIGGILMDDLEDLFLTGIYGVAVSSAITTMQDRILSTEKFLKQIKELSYVENS